MLSLETWHHVGNTAATLLISYATLQANPYRKVLEDDGKGRQLVETESLATWRFLMFKGVCHLVPTSMHV